MCDDRYMDYPSDAYAPDGVVIDGAWFEPFIIPMRILLLNSLFIPISLKATRPCDHSGKAGSHGLPGHAGFRQAVLCLPGE